jgi:carboxyl-terminal processing protease
MKRLTPILVTAICILLGYLVGAKNTASEFENHIEQHIIVKSDNKLNEVLSLVNGLYVENIDMDTLIEKSIPKVLTELDPHSVYIPKEEVESSNAELESSFSGIGIRFTIQEDTINISDIIRGGPSELVGLLPGDRIIKVNDTLIAGQKMSQTSVMKRLRGPRGTQVKLSIERKDIKDLVDIVVTRDAIPLHSVEASLMLTEDIGFIKLSQFARTSFAEIKKALASLRTQGMTSLIFDLRGNSGGFLDQAILIANEFLPANSLIVYTEDRNGKQLRQYSDGRGGSTDLKMVVLIDEGSASSSEILAGALQDNDRSTIIGRRSFGKGLVQQQIAYDDGSALRLTVARYYTPTGRSIQRPYENGDEMDYRMDIVRRYNNNEFFSADSIHFADSLKYTTPQGRTVYGGGGIMPDRFIPMDTTYFSPYYIEVTGRNILYRYTMDYADRHREALNKVQTMEELTQLLDSDRRLFDDFVVYAQRHGVRPSQGDFAKSRKVMESQLRAYIGRNTVLEDDGFYYNIFPIDNVVSAAIDYLRDTPAQTKPTPERRKLIDIDEE